MEDRRRDQRHRTFKGGSISFDSASGIACVVRSLSDTGACLEIARPDGIPDDFTLVIKPEFLKRSCHVAWRAAHKIGVRFA